MPVSSRKRLVWKLWAVNRPIPAPTARTRFSCCAFVRNRTTHHPSLSFPCVLLPRRPITHYTLEILCADCTYGTDQTPFPHPTWVPLIPLPRLIRRRS
jgi:hypothetical protein